MLLIGSESHSCHCLLVFPQPHRAVHSSKSHLTHALIGRSSQEAPVGSSVPDTNTQLCFANNATTQRIEETRGKSLMASSKSSVNTTLNVPWLASHLPQRKTTTELSLWDVSLKRNRKVWKTVVVLRMLTCQRDEGGHFLMNSLTTNKTAGWAYGELSRPPPPKQWD